MIETLSDDEASVQTHLAKECFNLSKELELLKKLFKVTEELDRNYCTVINREDFSLGLDGEKMDEINNLLIEIEEFLKDK